MSCSASGAPSCARSTGIALHGEVYNVFAITDDTIIRIEDYAQREAALAAAGLVGD
jgi:hypothetical protein